MPRKASGKGSSNGGPESVDVLEKMSPHPSSVSMGRPRNPIKLYGAKIGRLFSQKMFGESSISTSEEVYLKIKKDECRLREKKNFVYLTKIFILKKAYLCFLESTFIVEMSKSFLLHICYPGLHHLLAISSSLTLVPIIVILSRLNLRMHGKCLAQGLK